MKWVYLLLLFIAAIIQKELVLTNFKTKNGMINLLGVKDLKLKVLKLKICISIY